MNPDEEITLEQNLNKKKSDEIGNAFNVSQISASENSPPVEKDASLENNEKNKIQKRKNRRSRDEINEEKALRALVSFLPKNKRKNARAFINDLANDDSVEIVNSRVFRKNKAIGHLTAILAKEFLGNASHSSSSTPHRQNNKSCLYKPKFATEISFSN